MATKHQSKDDHLDKAYTAIYNGRTNPIILRQLAGVGYDEARFDGLMQLYEAGFGLHSEQRRLKAVALTKHTEWMTKWQAADKEYRLLLGTVALCLGKDNTIKATFGLGRALENKKYARWRVNVDVTSKAAMREPHKYKLANHGWTEAKSAEFAALIAEAEMAHVAWIAADGEGQEATRRRDLELAKLDKEMKRLRKFAFLVLEDEYPQLLESMGYMVRSGPTPIKKSEQAATPTTAESAPPDSSPNTLTAQ